MNSDEEKIEGLIAEALVAQEAVSSLTNWTLLLESDSMSILLVVTEECVEQVICVRVFDRVAR